MSTSISELTVESEETLSEALSEAVSDPNQEWSGLKSLLGIEPASEPELVERIVSTIHAWIDSSQPGRTKKAVSVLGRAACVAQQNEDAWLIIRMQMLDALNKGIAHPNATVRRAAIEVIAADADFLQEFIALLVGSVTDSDDGVQLAAFVALGSSTQELDKTAMSALIAAMRHTSADARKAAIRALRRCQIDLASVAVEALCRALRDVDASVRGEAIETLVWLKDDAEDAIPGLLKIASKGEKSLRIKAVEAIMTIDPSGGLTITGIRTCTAQKEMVEALCLVGEKGRSLRKKIASISFSQPEPKLQADETVTIVSKGCLALKLGAHNAISLPAGDLRKIIGAFAQKIANDELEEMTWDEVDRETNRGRKKRSEAAQRQWLRRRNLEMEKSYGTAPGGEGWLYTLPKKGIRLNSKVCWKISADVKQTFSTKSAQASSWDPSVMAENHSDDHRKHNSEDDWGDDGWRDDDDE